MKKLEISLISSLALVSLGLNAATLELDLEEGWTLAGTPFTISELSPLDSTSIPIVYKYTTTGWQYYSGAEGDLSTLHSGDGFWVKSTETQSLSFSGESPETTQLALMSGWNLVALKSTDTASGSQLFANSCLDYIAAYRSGEWTIADSSESIVLTPGMGFWAKTNSACTIETAATESTVSSDADVTIRVVSTPNPSVFPLLLALSDNPDLPVELVPVSGSSTIDSAFAEGRGDALLSMTFVAAKKSVTESTPSMRLKTANLWRGFFELTRTDDAITSLSELKGQNLIISGPVGSGENGGPDIFFQAALRAQGLSLDDFNMLYMSQTEGIPAATGQTLLDDGDGDTSNDSPAAGILLVDPAASGMVMSAMMGETAFEKGIDMQMQFPSYASWENTELPLGGLSVLQSVDDNSSYSDAVSQLVTAYQAAADKIMDAQGSLPTLNTISSTIAESFATYYADYGLEVPSTVIMAGIRNGDFIYRTDRSVESIKSDLDAFLEFVIEADVEEDFYTQP